MRQARIKISPDEGEAVYNCVTRTVNRERLFDDVAKEVLRRQMWQLADYCGVHVLAYALLSNHFHVLVSVPARQAVSDQELLRRYQVLYPRPTLYQAAGLAVIRAELASNGEVAVAWRRRQLALMGDISAFMKLLKQRFSTWFNRTHQRIGTLWSERFKSTLIEGEKSILQKVAAYIDLNSVRAGLVRDPKDYRFCGYAEAVVGNEKARTGIRSVIGGRIWSDVQAQYRELLFGTGAGPRASATVPVESFQRVVAEGGHLPLATILRCRVRYFTDGAVLGSRAFVQSQLIRYRQKNATRRIAAPRPLPAYIEWGDIATLRGLRKQAVS